MIVSGYVPCLIDRNFGRLCLVKVFRLVDLLYVISAKGSKIFVGSSVSREQIQENPMQISASFLLSHKNSLTLTQGIDILL